MTRDMRRWLASQIVSQAELERQRLVIDRHQYRMHVYELWALAALCCVVAILIACW